jgi:hypothetical protein
MNSGINTLSKFGPPKDPLLQMASGVYLMFFGSFVFGSHSFPSRTFRFRHERNGTQQSLLILHAPLPSFGW